MVFEIDLNNIEEDAIRLLSGEEQENTHATTAQTPVALPQSPDVPVVRVVPNNTIQIAAGRSESPFYRVREYPWEGIATPVRGINHVDAALTAAGINYKVIQVPVRVEGKIIKHRVANIRADTREFIEVVSNRYTPFQNYQAYAFLEGAVSTGAMQLENAGEFGYDSVFIQARVGKDINVLGDAIAPYALIKNSHDGSSGVKVCFTPTRVICRNTLALALKTAPRVWQAKHLRTIEDRMEELQHMMQLAANYTDGIPEVAEKMNGINIADNEIVSVLKKMFPLKKDAGQRAENTVRDAVTEIMVIYNKTKDLERFHGTAWGFYNAVGDYVTHHVPKETENWRQNRLNRIADGHPLLEVAQRELMAIPA
jgi:phage/plasmid-like protein (TIGR03299 family)